MKNERVVHFVRNAVCTVILLGIIAFIACVLAGIIPILPKGNGISEDFVPMKVAPYMTSFGESNNDWHYYVDERSGVVYIARDQTYGFGITPAYNADGTLMTRDQLK